MREKIVIQICIVFTLLGTILVLPTNVSAGGEVGEVTSTWSSKSIEQGNNGHVTLSMENVGEDQIRLTFIGVHFDWMEDDIYWKDGSVSNENPHYLASGQTYNSYLVFEVPTNVLTGNHGYYFYIAYEEDDGWMGWEYLTWESQEQHDFRVTEIDTDGDGIPDSADNYFGPGANPPSVEDDLLDPDSSGIGVGIIMIIILGTIAIFGVIVAVIILVVKSAKKKKQSSYISMTNETPITPSDRKPTFNDSTHFPPPPKDYVPRPPRIEKKTPEIKLVKDKGISICPYCGKDLDFPKPPKFCPYCKEKISM